MSATGTPTRAIAAGVLDDALIEALARLVALLDEPQAVPVRAPLIERELQYRMLSGEHGRRSAMTTTTSFHRHFGAAPAADAARLRREASGRGGVAARQGCRRSPRSTASASRWFARIPIPTRSNSSVATARTAARFSVSLPVENISIV